MWAKGERHLLARNIISRPNKSNKIEIPTGLLQTLVSYTLETHLVIVAKEREHTDGLSRKFAQSYEELVYADLQLLLKRILKDVSDGLVSVLP